MAGDPGPAPAPSTGRCCFNPRPPSMAGDPPIRIGCVMVDVFQSAPAIDGGRSERGQRICRGHEPVSIRARHRWRAIRLADKLATRHGWLQSAPAIDGGRSHQGHHVGRLHVVFQSAPAIDGGRSLGRGNLSQGHHVSIRARHRWRAIRSWTPADRPMRSCFNPRPPSMAGDPAVGQIDHRL